jgi:hypothetical protein
MSDCQNGMSHHFVVDCTAAGKVESVGAHIFKPSMVGMSLALPPIGQIDLLS